MSDNGTRTPLRTAPPLPRSPEDRPSLDTLMARAHVAWAKRHQPWLLKQAA